MQPVIVLQTSERNANNTLITIASTTATHKFLLYHLRADRQRPAGVEPRQDGVVTRDSDHPHRRPAGIMDTVEAEQAVDTIRRGTRIPQDVAHRRWGVITTIRHHLRIIIITGITAAAAAAELDHRLEEVDQDRLHSALGTRRAAEEVAVVFAGTLRRWDHRGDCQRRGSRPGAEDDYPPLLCAAVEAAFEHRRRFGDGSDAERDDRSARSARGYSRPRRCEGTS